MTRLTKKQVERNKSFAHHPKKISDHPNISIIGEKGLFRLSAENKNEIETYMSKYQVCSIIGHVKMTDNKLYFCCWDYPAIELGHNMMLVDAAMQVIKCIIADRENM